MRTDPRLCPMKVLAHRGARAHVAENTVAAFDAARAAGVDGIEFDIRLSADGVAVIVHDDDLAVATDGTGSLAETTHDQLRSIRVAGAEPIPTLDEALAAMDGLLAMAELKAVQDPDGSIGASAVLAVTADRLRAVPDLIVTSFDPVALAAARERLPGVPTALACYPTGDDDWIFDVVAQAGHEIISVPSPFTSDTFEERVRSAGAKLFVWSIEPDQVVAARDRGAAAVIVDDPAATMRALGRA